MYGEHNEIGMNFTHKWTRVIFDRHTTEQQANTLMQPIMREQKHMVMLANKFFNVWPVYAVYNIPSSSSFPIYS